MEQPPDIFRGVNELLTNVLQNRVISKHFTNLRPPSSSNLTPADYLSVQRTTNNVTRNKIHYGANWYNSPQNVTECCAEFGKRLVILQEYHGSHTPLIIKAKQYQRIIDCE